MTRCGGLIKFQVACKTGSLARAKKEDTQSWRGAQKAAALLMFPGGNGTLK